MSVKQKSFISKTVRSLLVFDSPVKLRTLVRMLMTHSAFSIETTGCLYSLYEACYFNMRTTELLTTQCVHHVSFVSYCNKHLIDKNVLDLNVPPEASLVTLFKN